MEDDDDDQLTYELGSDESPSLAVVQAVATLTGRSVRTLPPLGERIDPDSLDGLVMEGDTSECTFRYAGCLVSVSQERVIVEELD